MPVVRGAVRARAKRVLKQLFPSNHKHVEGLSTEAKIPFTQLSLLEHYIRKTKLKTLVRSVLIAGDVTGQWNMMLDWTKDTRSVLRLVRRNPIIESIDGDDVSELEIEDPTTEEEELDEEEITEEGPEIIDFATEDLAVVPPTCNDLQKAKIVALRVRFSAEAVNEKVDEGVFILPENTKIEDFCKLDARRDRHRPDKKQTNDAGIKTEGTNKYALIYLAYMKLPFDGKDKPKSQAIVFYAGKSEIVGLIRNPLWSGRRPLISKPVERAAGSFFGKSPIEPVKFLQWQLIDFHNMGQDSAAYSLLPVFAADPLNNPNWAAMTLALGAVWPIGPDNIKRIEFGQLWKDADQKVEMMRRQIWEALDVNEMMMGRTPQGRKNNQLIGGMQQEQSTNISDDASNFEEEVLNDLLEMLFEFDQQYRTADLTIETRGEIGVRAKVEIIPVQQWQERFFFRWAGTEMMMGMQRLQQQISFMNVLKGIPPQQLNGRKIDITPILERAVENLFGPELAPLILIDERSHYTVSADVENEMMHNQIEVHVHAQDDDPEHLQSHIKAAALTKDPAGIYHRHIQEHMAQLITKREAQLAQQAPKGLPGAPGGGPGTMPPMGAAGAPRPGAMPAPGGPRPAQNPPGAVPSGQMMDGMVGPRG